MAEKVTDKGTISTANLPSIPKKKQTQEKSTVQENSKEGESLLKDLFKKEPSTEGLTPQPASSNEHMEYQASWERQVDQAIKNQKVVSYGTFMKPMEIRVHVMVRGFVSSLKGCCG